jgi:hypothetical protein
METDTAVGSWTGGDLEEVELEKDDGGNTGNMVVFEELGPKNSKEKIGNLGTSNREGRVYQ